MNTILCFGDSNTWGYVPGTGARYPLAERWPSVMAEELGEGYTVIPEGLNGRTTVWDDPVEGDKNGRRHLSVLLQSHCPLELVAIMLGTNDLKRRFAASSRDIASGAGVLVDLVHRSGAGRAGGRPDVLLIAPPMLRNLPSNEEVFEGAEERASLFPEYYADIASQLGCHFLDAAEVVVPSEIDGVHLDPSEHLKLGTVVAERVRSILEGRLGGADCGIA